MISFRNLEIWFDFNRMIILLKLVMILIAT